MYRRVPLSPEISKPFVSHIRVISLACQYSCLSSSFSMFQATFAMYMSTSYLFCLLVFVCFVVVVVCFKAWSIVFRSGLAPLSHNKIFTIEAFCSQLLTFMYGPSCV